MLERPRRNIWASHNDAENRKTDLEDLLQLWQTFSAMCNKVGANPGAEFS